jgi:hypothetical protein
LASPGAAPTFGILRISLSFFYKELFEDFLFLALKKNCVLRMRNHKAVQLQDARQSLCD